MKVIVKPHTIQVINTPVNEQEINVTTVDFEFSDDFDATFTKEAYFTLKGDTYKQIIINNQCEIPSEVLTEPGEIELGVVAFNSTQRYNPKPGYFTTLEGSLKDAENSQPITPSELEQYELQLQEGLNEVNGKLDDIDTALNEVNNLDIDANKVGTTTTITITDKSGTSKEVQVLDGTNGTNGRDGRDGVDGKDGVDGRNGIDGVDGVSPIATVTKSGSTSTITITDKNGTTTAIVSDGINGTNGTDGRDGYVQYTAGENITIENNVISAVGGDLSNYATKQYVDTDQHQVYRFEIPTTFSYNNENYTTDAIKESATDLINYYYGKQIKNAIVLLKTNYNYTFIMSNESPLTNQDRMYLFDGYSFNGNTLYLVTFRINGTWENNVFTSTGVTTFQKIEYNKTQFMTGVKDVKTTNLDKFWSGTLSEYNAIQNKDADTFYNITDDYSNNGLPSAGTTGQVLAKASNSDFDTEWVSQHSFSHETWTFTLDDDTTVDKEVVLW